ncbi:MAG: conjugal transfer protein TraX [Bacilli bacterium]|nr:conjugal transfer protein TraX [Bacilli bacterium]
MSSFLLKIIAFISMVIDHSSTLIDNNLLICIGRIAFPIFAFQTTISYQKTKNRKKYLLKLLIFALISEMPYRLLFGNSSFNILFTLLLGNICMIIYDKIKEKSLSIVLILLISILASGIRIDYGYYGIWMIVLFYIFRNNKLLQNISIILLMIMYFSIGLLIYETTIYNQLSLFIFSLISLLIINLYNGKEGKKTGYLFYILYPLHLIIFYIIKRML